MKVIQQYKAIGPYNYDRIIHNTEQINAKRHNRGHSYTERCISFKNTNFCVICKSKRFQTFWIWSILPVTCTALGYLHIKTKHILAYDQYYYIGERKAYKK